MRFEKTRKTNRSFRWGADPLFSRGLHVAPPVIAVVPGERPARSRSVRSSRRSRPALVAGFTASLFLHGFAIAVWRGPGLSPEDAGEFARRPEGAELRVIELAPMQQSEPFELARREPAPDARPVPRAELALGEVAVSRPPLDVGRVETTPARGVRHAVVPVFMAEDVAFGALDSPGDNGPKSLVASRARSVLHTWKPPRSLRGLEMLVRVETDARGRPTGAVELLPPTRDEATNHELRHRARSLQYVPALEDGKPVAGWAEISYRFCGNGVTAASPPSPTFGRRNPCRSR